MSHQQPTKRNLTLDLKPEIPATIAGGGPGGGGGMPSAIAPSKKARLGPSAPELLTSPDVQMLKLTSPQLAEFLSRNPTLATPTPSGGGYPFPTSVSAEQELYVRGFEEALKMKHAAAQENNGASSALAGGNTPASILAIEKATAAFKQQQQQHTITVPVTAVQQMQQAAQIVADQAATLQQAAMPAARLPTIAISSAASTVSELSSTNSRPSSSASGSCDDTASDYLPTTVVVKQEPGVDDSHMTSTSRGGKGKSRKSSTKNGVNISPINMESQEVIKLERKRLRNRLAASKCRKRKLERISNLDDKVSDLKEENGELSAIVKRLKESVCNLKQEVMEHVTHGCQINLVHSSQGSV